MIGRLKNVVKAWVYGFESAYNFFKWYCGLRTDYKVVREARDPLFVYRQDLLGIQALPINDPVETCRNLPESLVLLPNVYKFRGVDYDCTTPGLYRFVAPQHVNRQHVVLDSADPVLSALLLSFLSVRGNRDDRRLIKSLERLASERFLSMTCGPNCIFCQEILQTYGVLSRVVYSHTYQPMDSYNNGHVLLEVYSPEHKKYVIVDVDKKCTFHQGKNILSLFEYSQAIYRNETFEIKFYSPVSMVDLSGFVERPTDFHYGFIEYAVYSSKTALVDCLTRICEVPIIAIDGITFACAWNAAVEDVLKNINSTWQIIDADEFRKRFYDY